MVITDIFKLDYAEPRPYWVSPTITAYKCSSQFGHPSGHSSITMTMSFLLWLDIFVTWTNVSRTKMLIILIPFLLFPLTVAYSRMILGVHAIN